MLLILKYIQTSILIPLPPYPDLLNPNFNLFLIVLETI